MWTVNVVMQKKKNLSYAYLKGNFPAIQPSKHLTLGPTIAL